MKLMLLITLLLIAAMPAAAQVDVSASVFAITNTPAGAQQIGLGAGGGFRYERAYIGLDVFGDPSRQNPKQLTRGRAFLTYDAVSYAGFKFAVGGGGFKTGNETGGFGQLGLNYDRFTAWGRYGNQDFVEADGSFAVISTDRFAVAPFYRFTGLAGQPRLHQAGLRFTLR